MNDLNLDKFSFAKICKEQNNTLNLPYVKKFWRFPKEKPVGVSRPDSFLGEENKQVFKNFVNKDTKIIAEFGSWYGASARYWCDLLKENNSDGLVIANDHFRMSTEHLVQQKYAEQSKTMYDDFIVTNWEYRDKMLVMPMTALTALEILHICKVEPDIIYLDNSHDYISVRNDLELSLALFDYKKTLIVGDDWFMKTVRDAVVDVCNEQNLKLEHSPNNVWWIGK